MSLQEIIVKILFFFAVFYGAVFITAVVSKKFNLDKKANPEEEKSSSSKDD